ncbi:MAG: peptide chain release factor N(5)-glutamine methyltransferase [Chloroflexi bacterium]|nr:peptide chain release factor N(5)-glutamine methyltransferase [Chloroflexota bacterium]MCY4247329.1 peptide chain release factor N(5)-glutamine methyltransferase [Chloroflexota bacterium]
MTIREALQLARRRLANSDSPDLDAQLLLARALDSDRAFLFTHPEQPLLPAQLCEYQNWLARRAAGEPIAYILGAAGFYDIELRVNPAVLIPRPESELLLEEALRLTAQAADVVAADIGTGSGALAIAYKRLRPLDTVYATDICAAALCLAKENARQNNVSLRFLRGDLAQPLFERGIRVDLLMANLPYIASGELPGLAVSAYEPRLALDGGADGLDCIRALLDQAMAICSLGAHALLEIGAGQGQAVQRLAWERCGAEASILHDYAGLDRIARLMFNQSR